MAKFISRRDFLKGTAAGALGLAAGSLFGGKVEAKAEGPGGPAPAEVSPNPNITWDDIFATSYSQANRRSNPDAKAPENPEEYIVQKGNGDIGPSLMVGTVGALGITEDKFMNNKPAWLGDEPDLSGKVSYTKEADVLVIGSGQAGTSATLHCADQGLKVICCEVQTWEEYDNYACDLTTYNSKFFLDKGAEKYDPNDIFTEYMNKALGHANQKIVMDYAKRSGEALDWMLAYLPEDYVAPARRATPTTICGPTRSACFSRRRRSSARNTSTAHRASPWCMTTARSPAPSLPMWTAITSRSTPRRSLWRPATSAATRTCVSTSATSFATWPGPTAWTVPMSTTSAPWAVTDPASA